MNIDYRTGDLLDADAEALVNTVNCVGVMGKGIALQFKKRFPDNFKGYSIACERDEVRPGQMFVFDTGRLDGKPRYIINFPTKGHWRSRSRLADVEAGLADLADQIRKREIRSIAMPALGCGHGGLEWEKVRPLIERKLGELSGDVRIVVFEPEGTPDTRTTSLSVEAPEMTPGRAALVTLMERYLSGQPRESRVLPEATVHDLVYFLQVAGEPLQLDYSDENGSPRAERLRRVLCKMEGHWISGRPDIREESGRLFELIPGAARDAGGFLGSRPDTRERVDRIGDLMDGFEKPLGVKLLASVHWAACHGRSASVGDVTRRLRGREFYRKQIEQAYQALKSLGWLRGEERSSRVLDEKLVSSTETDMSADTASEQGDDCLPCDGSSILNKININKATVYDLESLPRIGSKLAQAIVTCRDKDGPFRFASDIIKVPGIAEGLYKNIAPRITVGEYERRLL